MLPLAANMDEINWRNRLHDFNHVVHFKSNVTSIVDTFPIIVYQPVDSRMRNALYSGKYKATVLKIEIFVTFTGELVCATGVHMGTMHDSRVYNFCQHEHPLEQWEWILGDLAYIGNHHVITKHKKPRGGQLTDEQV